MNRKPNKVISRLTKVARRIARRLTGDEFTDLYVTDTRCGRCNDKNITVPKWAYLKNEKKPGYFVYYIAHEISHRYNTDGWHHDKSFYDWFKLVCPEEHQHYELGYKPRVASAMGINKKDL